MFFYLFDNELNKNKNLTDFKQFCQKVIIVFPICISPPSDMSMILIISKAFHITHSHTHKIVTIINSVADIYIYPIL